MPHRRLGPLGVRFAAAFVAVALAAVVVFAVAVLIADQGNVARLAANERARTTAAVVALAANAYQTADGWAHADLGPVTTYAQQSGVAVDLRDRGGAGLLSVPAPPRGGGQLDVDQQDVPANGAPV